MQHVQAFAPKAVSNFAPIFPTLHARRKETDTTIIEEVQCAKGETEKENG